MSRGTLVLYQLDRDELKRLSGELEALLASDDRAGLAALLEVDGAILGGRSRLVDFFLVAAGDEAADLLGAATRRVAKKRALTPVFASDSPALEGRLRAYDALRDDASAAAAVDKLLSPKRLPWYLRAPGATCGWLGGAERHALAVRLERLRSALTPELAAFSVGLGEIDGDVVAHDSL